jgi:hypothetical protein
VSWPWPSRTFLAFLVVGVLIGLLTMGASLLVGDPPATSEDLEDYCIGLQVGSSDAADTHLYIQNRGLGAAQIRFDWGNQYSTVLAPPDARLGLAPGGAETIVFRAPQLGAELRLRSSVPNLYANAVIHRDDGTDPETRDAILCLGGSDPY